MMTFVTWNRGCSKTATCFVPLAVSSTMYPVTFGSCCLRDGVLQGDASLPPFFCMIFFTGLTPGLTPGMGMGMGLGLGAGTGTGTGTRLSMYESSLFLTVHTLVASLASLDSLDSLACFTPRKRFGRRLSTALYLRGYRIALYLKRSVACKDGVCFATGASRRENNDGAGVGVGACACACVETFSPPVPSTCATLPIHPMKTWTSVNTHVDIKPYATVLHGSQLNGNMGLMRACVSIHMFARAGMYCFNKPMTTLRRGR